MDLSIYKAARQAMERLPTSDYQTVVNAIVTLAEIAGVNDDGLRMAVGVYQSVHRAEFRAVVTDDDGFLAHTIYVVTYSSGQPASVSYTPPVYQDAA